VVVRAAGHQRVFLLSESDLERLGVLDDLLLVQLEVFGLRLLERNR
jgi:hypothetical protein